LAIATSGPFTQFAAARAVPADVARTTASK
jgi:hypothetical protein